jgi:DNA-binding GntR family transcriptional regulator
VRILRALSRHDAAAAERLVKQHVASGRNYVVKSLRGAQR